MDAKVTWQKGMTFSGTAGTGSPVPLGAHPDVGGANDGFRPMELMAVSLAGCTAMDVISILVKKRQDISGFEVDVQAGQSSEHPRVFIHAVIEYNITGHNLDEAAILRALELSATRYCPAQGMLARVMPIELKYNIYEGENQNQRKLVRSGGYSPQLTA